MTDDRILAMIAEGLRRARDEQLDEDGRHVVALRAVLEGRPNLTVPEAWKLVKHHLANTPI